jgi:pre-mRNA-splicing factor SYF1
MEKATKVPFKTVDELAEVWCEWAEMELRNESVQLICCCDLQDPTLTFLMISRNFDEAIRVMQRATTTPKNTKISFHDEVRPSRPGCPFDYRS